MGPQPIMYFLQVLNTDRAKKEFYRREHISKYYTDKEHCLKRARKLREQGFDVHVWHTVNHWVELEF